MSPLDENPTLEGLLASLSVPLQVSRKRIPALWRVALAGTATERKDVEYTPEYFHCVIHTLPSTYTLLHHMFSQQSLRFARYANECTLLPAVMCMMLCRNYTYCLTYMYMDTSHSS